MRMGRVMGAAALAATGLLLARRARDRRRAATPARGAEPRVIVVGGGFGGLAAARVLGRSDLRVTLVDRKNHHLFQPLLYQVATAGLSPGDIAAPIRHVLRRERNIEVILGDVVRLHPAARTVELADGTRLEYEFLVLATGATHAYFGHEDWAPLAPGLKTLEDAVEIRRRVLTAYERAEREPDPAAQRALLTFVVVGGGPTGVELAGALAEISRYTLAADFRHIHPESARVVLVEAMPRVLPAYSDRLSAAARCQLEGLGVEVRTEAPVTRIDPDGVELAGGERIASRTVLWGAGVAASPLGRELGASLDRAGRAEVRPDLSVPGRPEVFVIGDLARVVQRGVPVPGLAPAAIQEGRTAARNVIRLARGRRTLPFRYRDRGTLSTIGRAAAVGEVFGVEVTGLAAWLLWLFVHIFYLIGFRNRVAVLADWAWSYATFSRGARLITDTSERRRFLAEHRRQPPPDLAGAGAAPP
jgi:NADH dehydrogenase